MNSLISRRNQVGGGCPESRRSGGGTRVRRLLRALILRPGSVIFVREVSNRVPDVGRARLGSGHRQPSQRVAKFIGELTTLGVSGSQ